MLEAAPHYRRYRVPRENGAWLLEPAASDVPRLINAAQSRLAESQVSMAGMALRELRERARQSLVRLASRYSSQYVDVGEPTLAGPLLLGGHQAELFHPGVWFKNFVLDRLAQQSGGMAIHLVIDTDLCRAATLRVPSGSIASPHVETLAFDRGRFARPAEEWRVEDAALFASLPARTQQMLVPMDQRPLIHQLWPLVQTQLDACDGRWGWAVARGRHQLEHRWGSRTLEIPYSLVCQMAEVRHLLLGILLDLPRFVTCYNGALARYRAAHRFRSPAQPLPDLASAGEWCEAPLWIYHANDPHRRALFARQTAAGLELTDRHDWQAALPESVDDALAQWSRWEAEGVRIRTRALTTTLVARLVLGDLFVHGIGGAKYDEVTTDFARQFYGIEPAPYVATTATLLLPVPHDPTPATAVREIDRQLRDARFHPERWLQGSSVPEVQRLIATKAQWLATPSSPQGGAERHRGITSANSGLARYLTGQVEEWNARRERALREVRGTEVLEKRDYPFALYSEQWLVGRLTQLATTSTAELR